MAKFENDFVNEELVSFDIDGRLFKYKPVTAQEETKWYPEYMEIIEKIVNGNIVNVKEANIEKLTMCKLMNLIEVPYDKDNIKNILRIDSEWKNLTKEQRWAFMGKLRPKMFDKIIVKMNEIDEPSKKKP
jgi:hypothetical protein